MPTIKIIGQYRFHFYSADCGEGRKHIHVVTQGRGDAKFWLEPEIALERNRGFRPKELRKIETLVRENIDEFVESWDNFCGGN